MYYICVSMKSAFVGIQNQDFNYVMHFITLHRTSCTYNTFFLEAASLLISVVRFVDDAHWPAFPTLAEGDTRVPE